MQIDRLRQAAAWLAMVALIMIAGLKAQADDAPKSDAQDQKEKDQVQVREVRLTQKQDAKGNDVEVRSIVVAVDPGASADQVNEQLRVLIDNPAIGGYRRQSCTHLAHRSRSRRRHPDRPSRRGPASGRPGQILDRRANQRRGTRHRSEAQPRRRSRRWSAKCWPTAPPANPISSNTTLSWR